MSIEDTPREAYVLFLRPNEAELIAQELELGAKGIRSRMEYLQFKLKKQHNPETHLFTAEPDCTHQNTNYLRKGKISVNIPERFLTQYVNYLIAKDFRFEIIPSDRDGAVCFQLIEKENTDSQLRPFLKAYANFSGEVEA